MTPQEPYEFAKRFEKIGLKAETFSIVPQTKEQKERMDLLTNGVKKFIQECEIAYQAPKQPTIRFCQKRFSRSR